MKRQSEATIPIPQGTFNLLAYADDNGEQMPHVALVSEGLDVSEPVTIRIHSECLTGDLFGSKRCDCGEQLQKSLEIIAKEKGVLLYLRQEGRGIGLINKLKAYQLQDVGLNTIDANTHLGFEVDGRHYDIAIQMLQDLKISKINLLTNNPEKIAAFDDADVEVIKRLPLITTPIPENEGYLSTKQNLLGHLLNNSEEQNHSI